MHAAQAADAPSARLSPPHRADGAAPATEITAIAGGGAREAHADPAAPGGRKARKGIFARARNAHRRCGRARSGLSEPRNERAQRLRIETVPLAEKGVPRRNIRARDDPAAVQPLRLEKRPAVRYAAVDRDKGGRGRAQCAEKGADGCGEILAVDRKDDNCAARTRSLLRRALRAGDRRRSAPERERLRAELPRQKVRDRAAVPAARKIKHAIHLRPSPASRRIRAARRA